MVLFFITEPRGVGRVGQCTRLKPEIYPFDPDTPHYRHVVNRNDARLSIENDAGSTPVVVACLTALTKPFIPHPSVNKEGGKKNKYGNRAVLVCNSEVRVLMGRGSTPAPAWRCYYRFRMYGVMDELD